MNQDLSSANSFALPVRPVAAMSLVELGATAGSDASRQKLLCHNMLTPDEQVLARAEAAKLLPQMLASTPVMMEYGGSALHDLNVLSDRILNEVRSITIPELTEIMKQTNDRMRAIRNKYDVSDSKVRAKFERGGGFFRRLFGRGRSWAEMLMDDARSLEATLDKVVVELNGRQKDLQVNVVTYDQLYAANEHEVRSLVVVIAVMEYIHELAAHEVERIKGKPGSLDDRELSEQARMIAEFAINLATKIGDYKNRLFVGYATGPNLTMMRTLDIGVAQKLNQLVGVTIPTVKQTIALWQMRAKSVDASKMGAVATDMTNDVLQSFARNTADSTYEVAAFAQSSSLTPETISLMAESVSLQVDGLLEAYQEGQMRRNQAEAAIIEGRKVIAAAGQRLTAGVVDQVIGAAARPVPASLSS